MRSHTTKIQVRRSNPYLNVSNSFACMRTLLPDVRTLFICYVNTLGCCATTFTCCASTYIWYEFVCM